MDAEDLTAPAQPFENPNHLHGWWSQWLTMQFCQARGLAEAVIACENGINKRVAKNHAGP